MNLSPKLQRKVDVFEKNFHAYTSSNYKEDQLRAEFIDILFEELGWDMTNRRGYAEPYKDVIHEDSISFGGSSKAPDYCFRIGGYRRFFVEAKKPSVDIIHDTAAAYQLRRYAWSAKLPISILTNFKHISIYDCRHKPLKNDDASTCRLFIVPYEDLHKHWDFLSKTFSRNAILDGTFDRYASSEVNKRGTTPVDAEFLGQLREWRGCLARGFMKANKKLNQVNLNYAVQRTIDRLIFLRISEDRGIEKPNRLRELIPSGSVYKKLCDIFLESDSRYNSGLFHFHKTNERPEPPDEICLKLKLDDDVLRPILEGLYYPESPYEFSVLPVDLIGQVYEQFLGQTIELDSTNRVRVCDKKDVRKAGGVFYTPTPVVEMMVHETLSPLFENKSLEEIKDIRILDPACGSGTFLIATYDYLYKHYLVRFTKNGEGQIGRDYERSQSGTAKLSLNRKRQILLSHLFGVDLDAQAVETTKLSLMLKLMEGENSESIDRFIGRYGSEALPDLGFNIKHGNSLLDSTALLETTLSFFEAESHAGNDLIPFDWEIEFPFGRFNAILGNPPYGAEVSKEVMSAYKRRYPHAKIENTYGIFLERSVDLLEEDGRMGMIIPSSFLTGPDFSNLRKFMVTRCDPKMLVNLPYDIFDAWVDTSITIFKKRSELAKWPRKDSSKIVLANFPKKYDVISAQIPSSFITEGSCKDWFSDGRDQYLTRLDRQTASILRKIEQNSVSFDTICDIQRGVTPYKTISSVTNKSCKPAFDGKLLRHTCFRENKVFIKMDSSIKEPKPEKYFNQPRVLLREIISRQMRLQAAYTYESFVTNKSVQSLLRLEGAPSIEAISAILNSKVISWHFLIHSSVGQQDDFPKIVLKETRKLPFPKVVPSNMEKNLNLLAKELNGLNEKSYFLKSKSAGSSLQKRITQLESRIDSIVFSLFNLSDDEIETINSLNWLNGSLGKNLQAEVA